MAKKTSIELIDDLDGSPAAETVQISLRGKLYEIDLSEVHAKELDAFLFPYLQAGRAVTARPRSGSRRTSKENSASARAWLRQQGHDLKERGRIPSDLMEKWMAAGSPRVTGTGFTEPTLS
jgi:hypothetical protein